MPNILIADDHALIREGLRKLLAPERDLHIAAEATNAAEALELLSRMKVDLVLLDINMPGRSGIELLYDLRKRFPKVKLLMLSMHPEETVAVRAMKAGASGYISKDAPPEELLNAIRKVLSGRKYVSQKLADQLAEDLAKPELSKPHEILSAREFEILCLFGKGKTVSEIAKKLSLSVPTVTTYRRRILQKLSLKTTAELIHYAIRHNLVEPLE
jgi:DNA-binding NarL/FixJ family response regulator